jgi:hypothetical protein
MEGSTMQPITIDQFTAPETPLTAQQALSQWFALLDDLDTLLLAYEGENMSIGPMHDAHASLTDHIMAYAPATSDEARAIIAIVNHNERDFMLSDDQLQARCRAFALLDIMASGNTRTQRGK